MPPLSLFAALAYLGVAALVLARRDERVARWRIAAILIALALWRLTGIGDSLLTTLRDTTQADGLYADRRIVQSAVIAVAMAGAATVAWYARPPALRAAWFATLALAGLALLRLVSLHQVDAILFSQHGGVSVGRIGEAVLLATILATSLIAAPGHASALAPNEGAER